MTPRVLDGTGGRAGRTIWLAPLLLGACAVGPDYHAPEASLPDTTGWKSAVEWRPAAPADQAARGPWWEVYADPELNRLEALALQANTSLAIAAAQLDVARAQATVANSALVPEVDIGAQASRARLSASRPTNGGTPTTRPAFQNTFQLPLTVSYELDLFGGVRRGAEAARAGVEATAADLESARLVISAEVANDYFALREADAEVAIDGRTVAALRRARAVIAERHRAGTASGLDLAAEDTTLANVEADLADATLSRAQYENALAVLVGVPAPEFHVAPVDTLTAFDTGTVLGVAVVPSHLLERRPDVAAAERRVAAANAAIGVATAAYFPALELTAAVGYESVAAPLVSAPNLAWALGAALSAPLFDAGRRHAGVEIARAGHDIAVAQYRAVALNAFAETEDALASLSLSAEAAAARARAASAARQSLALATRRYEVGVASYLDVVSAQQAQLGAERDAVRAQTRERLATVLLVKAVGGDYPRGTVPSASTAVP